MIRVLILALFIILPLPACAEQDDGPVPAKTFNAETFTLENGLEIVVIPNHRAPVVTHMVWYKVGAADEAQGQSGIAHFLEHLMFKGSEGLAAGEFSKTVRALGGNDNAFTSQDYTAYYQSIAAEYLEKVMEMESGRMRGMTLPLEEVDSERQVILEERRQRIDNNPQAQFSEQMNAALFVNHPYGTPVIGWFHEVEKLSRDYAKSFYDRWYGPNNAILVVSGDVTGEQVQALAQKTYGKLPRIDVPQRDRTSSPPLHSETRVTLHHPDNRQPTVQQGYRVPSTNQNKEDSLALQLLEEIAGGGPTSRFYKSLVVEQKLAVSAGLNYSSDAIDDAVLWVYAVPVPGVSLEDLEAAMEAELRKVVADGITEAELTDAKTRMIDSAIFARDSLSGPAMIFGRSLVTGSSIEDIEYWPQKISTVTAAQVQSVAKRFLDPDAEHENPVVTGYLLPPRAEEASAMEKNAP